MESITATRRMGVQRSLDFFELDLGQAPAPGWPPGPRRRHAAPPERRFPRPSRARGAAPRRCNASSACSSKVDLPMPGSPPMSTTAPSTTPPPSTGPIPLTGGGALHFRSLNIGNRATAPVGAKAAKRCCPRLPWVLTTDSSKSVPGTAMRACPAIWGWCHRSPGRRIPGSDRPYV